MLDLIIMLRTYLYIPDETNKNIDAALAYSDLSKAGFIREILEEGLKVIQKRSVKKINEGLKILSKIGEIGEKYNLKGPQDLSTNMDDYLWKNGKWKKPK